MHEDAAWLRRLAARLIKDPSLADDACQEAWLIATRRGLSDPSELRPALFRWMRRFAWRWRRAEARRSIHEQAAPDVGPHPSTEELLSRAEQRQRLWARLTELPEPYRTTLLLRYQEGASTASIAKHFSCPADTVRWRVRKGLSMLRQQYERDQGQSGFEALALVALPFPTHAVWKAAKPTALSTAGTTVAVGAWSMKKATVVLAAAVVLATGLGVHEALREEPISSPTEPSAAPKLASSTAPHSTEATGHTSDSGVTRKAPEPRVSDTALLESCRVYGVLVDADGAPLAGGEAHLIAGSSHWNATPIWRATERCLADGSFAVAPAQEQGDEDVRLELRASPFHEVVTLKFGPDSDCDHAALNTDPIDVGRIALAPAAVITGRLIDERGSPIDGAWIDDDQSRSFARSDENGVFRLEHLSPGRHSIEFKRPGFLTDSRDHSLPASVITDLGEITLAEAPRVRGRVTDETGVPLLGARVSTRGFTRGWVFDTENGHFDVPLPVAGPTRIYGRAEGHQQSDGLRVTPGQHDIEIRLLADLPRGRFLVLDDENGLPITRFGMRIEQDQRLDGIPPRPKRFREGRVSVACSVGDDYLELNAPGYERLMAEITEAAFEPEGQTVRLRRAAVVRGRLVDEHGQGLPGKEVQLRFGRVGRIEVSGTGKLVPFDADSAVGKVFKKQGGFSMHEMVEIDEPMPPFVMTRFGAQPLQRSQTDEDGYFLFPSGQGTGRVIVPGEQSVATEIFAVRGERGHDLGELVVRDAARLSIRLQPTPTVDLSGCTIDMRSLPGRSTGVSETGTFDFDPIPSGGHWFQVRTPASVLAPDLEMRSFFVRLKPGEDRILDLPVAAHLSCDLTLNALVNGAPMPTGSIDFETVEGDSAGSVEIGEGGSGQGVVRAGIALRAIAWMEDSPLDIAGTLILPSGSSTTKIELETAALEIRVPTWFQVPEDGQFELSWTRADGSLGRPQLVRLRDDNRVLGAVEAGIRVSFPHIPLEARRFRLTFREGGPYSRGDWRTLGTFERKLEKGTKPTIDL